MPAPQPRRYARKAFIALALVACAAWLVPSFISAERYRRRLEAGLEQALERQVTFGAVKFRLVPRPGFSIERAAVHEDPAFGSEPFARVERIDCELRWRSLWRPGIEFARLYLDHPTFNVVRNAHGEWNVERLLRKSGLVSPRDVESARARRAGGMDLDADGARINFKVREDKKPFAITDLRARLSFDPARGRLRYRLTGSPVRTDLSLPSPGTLELEGVWTPGQELDGPIETTLWTRKALLYDWVPLVTSRNPEIYGLLDATLRLTGSLALLKIQGEGELSQLHRWELPPPSDATPVDLQLQGEFDRQRGRVLVQDLGVSFAASRLHLAGSVDKIPISPELDLSLAFDHSRLQDLLALGHRFWGGSGTLGASGGVDGIVAVRGPWSGRRYGGLAIARDVRLSTPAGRFPVSEAFLRIEARGARLAPVTISLAPRIELVAEGTLGELRWDQRAREKHAYAELSLGRSGKHLPRVEARGRGPTEGGGARYELSFSAKALPLEELLHWVRSTGVRRVQGLDAEEGTASGAFRVAGALWPLAPPRLEGRVEVEDARLLVPGLSKPLSVSHALVQVGDGRVLAFPVAAAIGGNAFTGRLEREGRQPWKFQIRTDQLSLEQGALWFEALGHAPPPSIFDRLPGLSSFSRRTAASSLFGSLNAKGLFMASALTYRSLALTNFRASVEIADRVVRVSNATFRSGGGRGRGTAEVNLTTQPARWTGEVALDEASLQLAASRLPAALGRLRGSVSGSGRFETRGWLRQEMSANLRAQAALRLKGVSFGDFDPVETLAREGHLGTLEPARRGAMIRAAAITLLLRNSRVWLEDAPLQLEGARLRLSGSYGFDGTLDLGVRADLSHLARRWQSLEASASAPRSDERRSPDPLVVDVHLAGPLNALAVVPAAQISRFSPPAD